MAPNFLVQLPKSLPNGYEPNVVDRFWATMGNKITNARRTHALKSLEKKLADLITAAEDYKSRNIRSGDMRYRMLWSKADRLIEEFCKDWSIDRGELVNGWPAIDDLEQMTRERYLMTFDDHVRANAPKVLGGLLGLILVGVVIAALCANLYHFLTYFIR